MNKKQRDEIIAIITGREQLKRMSRVRRLFYSPFRSAPYYVLATLGHIRPFRISFKTLWGDRMHGYLPESGTFYYYGYCEANLANFLLRMINEGMVCIDVGAHIGYYSVLLSRLSGKNGSVHSFEPTPWTYNILKENTQDIGNIHINNLGLSDVTGTAEFSDYGPGYGAFNTAHMNGATGINKPSQSRTVSLTTLDSYVKGHNITPDFIKIDAEGFEYNILKGSTELLLKLRPIISIEVAGGESWKNERNGAFSVLKTANYNIFEITINGHLEPHEPKSTYTYDNLICIPAEKVSLMKNFIA